ncbi:hypothetical protein [Streptomyces sp. NPDC057939]|uniref:hypothetical protein n=1 Tax=Streptomyces sp. NPDC057939 TaxID=3346284 RepID=UPI0036EFF52F
MFTSDTASVVAAQPAPRLRRLAELPDSATQALEHAGVAVLWTTTSAFCPALAAARLLVVEALIGRTRRTRATGPGPEHPLGATGKVSRT